MIGQHGKPHFKEIIILSVLASLFLGYIKHQAGKKKKKKSRRCVI